MMPVSQARPFAPTQSRHNPIAEIPTRLVAQRAVVTAQGTIAVDMEPAIPPVDPRDRQASASVILNASGFADQRVKTDVKYIAIYEEGTDRLVAMVRNPTPTSEGGVWGQQAKTFGLSFPAGALKDGKKYTMVIATSVDDGPVKQVRSEYERPVFAL